MTAQTSGFLGNPQAELFDQLTCSLRVRGGASELLVLRKKGGVEPDREGRAAFWGLVVGVCVPARSRVFCALGAEFSSRMQQQSFVRMRMTKAVSGVFRTQVFSSRRTSLSDAHRFCQDGCSRDACCDGFILNQNSLNGGALPWRREPQQMNE